MLFVVVVTVHRAMKLKAMDLGLVAHIRNTGNRESFVCGAHVCAGLGVSWGLGFRPTLSSV